MPNISTVVTETKQSVMRPVILDVVRQLMSITKIPSTVPILYPDDIDKVAQIGSTIGEENSDSQLFPNSDKIFIEVAEDYDVTNMSSSPMTGDEYVPIFADPKLGIYLRPIYSKDEVSITFKFSATSKSMALRWRDDIRMRTSGGRDINLHTVKYHYIVPSDLIKVLREIHRLRETQEGYGESFDEYLRANSTERLTFVTNLSGSLVEPAIAETQMRIQGLFDFQAVPEKITAEDNSDCWVGSFTYNFFFDKPIACNLRYPVMVHNSVLTTDFRPAEQAYNLDEQLPSYSKSFNAFNSFDCSNQIRRHLNPYQTITIPSFDEFMPGSIQSGTVSIFNALCQISLNDKRNLLNLRDTGDASIDQSILDFIEAVEYRYITKPYQSILNISLYKFGNLMEHSLIDCSAGLDILSVKDLSLRDTHRIRFSLVADISYLRPESLLRLKNYPKAFVKIFSAINESLANNPGFADLGNKRQITKEDIERHIYGRGSPGRQILTRTVQVGSVVAHRRIN